MQEEQQEAGHVTLRLQPERASDKSWNLFFRTLFSSVGIGSEYLRIERYIEHRALSAEQQL